jgi:hypothetical protein
MVEGGWGGGTGCAVRRQESSLDRERGWRASGRQSGGPRRSRQMGGRSDRQHHMAGGVARDPRVVHPPILA